MRLALGLWIFTVNSRHSPRKVESAYSKDGDSICEMSMTVTSVLFIHGAVQARVRSTLIHIKSKSDNLMFPKVSFAAYPYFSFLFFFSFPRFHVGTGIIESLNFTSPIYKRVQCYWLRIGNKPSSPRDCTWHCNTSWTGEDEPFPIGWLT